MCTGLNWRPNLDGVSSRQVSLNGGNAFKTGTKITFSRIQFHGLGYVGPCYVKQPAEQATIKSDYSDKSLSSAVKVCDKIHTVNIKGFFSESCSQNEMNVYLFGETGLRS